MEGLSVALAVIQFVDFTSKLVSAAWKIHSGESSHGGERMLHLRAVTEDLTKHKDSLDLNLPSLFSDDAVLSDIVVKCSTLSRRLIDTLDSLQRQDQGKVWSSLRHALMEKWRESEIKAMSEDLKSYKQQIILHLVVSQVDLTTTMSHEIKQGIKNASENQLQAIQELRKELENVDGRRSSLAVIQGSYSGGIMIATPTPRIRQALRGKDTSDLSQHVIDKLYYSEINSRYKHIDVAHKETFEWLFQPPSKSTQWTDFSGWLQSDDPKSPLYWITGKPGAGKSTLMRFLVDHKRTLELTSFWKAGRPLLKASFFFWNSGTPLQMSFEGLTRSLLHQILMQAPETTQIALPHRVLDIMLFGEEIWSTQWVWSQEELTDACNTLIEEISKTHNVMIFIDGMDEFSGDLKEVIEFVQGVCKVPGVKICASSRPWNVFQDSFERHPHLRVERLTYNDIHKYVDSSLRASPTFRGYEYSHPGFPASLIKDVCTKADGVFLWVRLVTSSLLEGITDGEKPIELRGRLEELPTELELLFEKILWQVDPKDPKKLDRASRLFQIHRVISETSGAQSTLLFMSFADEYTPDDAVSAPIKLSTKERSHARAEQMKRRINACTRGLLDADTRSTTELPDARITLLHRTVRDYLYHEDIWSRICAAAPPCFNSYGHVFSSFVMMLKTESRDGYIHSYYEDMAYAMQYLDLANFESSAELRYLQSLDTMYTDLVCLPHDSSSVFAQTVKTLAESSLGWRCSDKSISLYLSVDDLVRVAFRGGIFTYLEQGLKLSSATASETASRCLLAVFSMAQTSPDNLDPDLNPDLVHMLLDSGADPNLQMKPSSTAGERLLMMMKHLDLKKHPDFLVVLEDFLDFGARFEGETILLKGILEEVSSDRSSLRDKISALLPPKRTSKMHRLLIRSIFDSIRKIAKRRNPDKGGRF